MSLTAAEQRQTSAELRANFDLAELTVAEVAADLGFATQRLVSTLDVDFASDPVDVWQLRDYLERVVVDSGFAPVPYSVLTEPSRVLARQWFRLRAAPVHVGPPRT